MTLNTVKEIQVFRASRDGAADFSELFSAAFGIHLDALQNVGFMGKIYTADDLQSSYTMEVESCRLLEQAVAVAPDAARRARLAAQRTLLIRMSA